MISKNLILQKLSPFTNTSVVVANDQTTDDIINGLLKNHNKYQSEYDKISEIFLGNNEKETAKNVFNFLKSNVPYYIEPIKKQTLRSPSAIVAIKNGADCKSYASFINGIFSSLNRKGIYHIPMAYRFASYRQGIQDPQHVFAVMYPGTNNEVWIDPVLDRFDLKKQPYYYKDKKIKMALIAMSGTATQKPATLSEMQNYRDKLVSLRDKMLVNGQIVPGSQNELQFKVAINKVTRAIQNASINGIENIDPTSPISVISNLIPFALNALAHPAADARGVIANLKPTIQSMDANSRINAVLNATKQISPKAKDVEARELILWYRQNYPSDVSTLSTMNKNAFNNYLNASAIQYANVNQAASDYRSALFTPSELSLNSNIVDKVTSSLNVPGTTSAGLSPVVILGLAGAGIYLLTRKK